MISVCHVLQGRYAGSAVGFRISSLLKLVETRANKPRMTLLHYLVDEARREDPHALQFAADLQQSLTAASRWGGPPELGRVQVHICFVWRFSRTHLLSSAQLSSALKSQG